MIRVTCRWWRSGSQAGGRCPVSVTSFPLTDVRGGNTEAENEMELAKAIAYAQWTNGIVADIEMVNEIVEPLEGELRFDADGEVEGPARVTFPSGNVYECEYQHGSRHGPGTVKWANGTTYVGHFENDKQHGPGTYTFTDGNVELCSYEEGDVKGCGLRLEKASGLFYLLKDGKKQEQVSKTEVRGCCLAVRRFISCRDRPRRW